MLSALLTLAQRNSNLIYTFHVTQITRELPVTTPNYHYLPIKAKFSLELQPLVTFPSYFQFS